MLLLPTATGNGLLLFGCLCGEALPGYGAERISFFVLEMNNENALFCLFVSFIFWLCTCSVLVAMLFSKQCLNDIITCHLLKTVRGLVSLFLSLISRFFWRCCPLLLHPSMRSRSFFLLAFIIYERKNTFESSQWRSNNFIPFPTLSLARIAPFSCWRYIPPPFKTTQGDSLMHLHLFY